MAKKKNGATRSRKSSPRGIMGNELTAEQVDSAGNVDEVIVEVRGEIAQLKV